MIILGIETSCDETAAAVLLKDQKGIQILSNVVASSASLQSKYGGIIPEQAAREQLKSMIPVITESLDQAKLKPRQLDAIAVTYGPGLIGSLLVGVETAKTLAAIWEKPLIPVNHLLGHFYANFINQNYESGIKNQGKSNHNSLFMIQTPSFPCIGLLVSGGHTDLVLFTDHNKYKYLGGTRDDAAGECFDKCARLLGLPYPGGPQISKLAQKGDASKITLPLPMKGHKDFDFSYSGLKTAVANLIHTSEVGFDSSEVKCDLAAAIEQTIVTSLVDKVILALKTYPVKDVLVAGGVAANQKLKEDLESRIRKLDSNIILHIPSPNLCTDNGAMIASAAFFTKPTHDPFSIQADPNLTL